MAIATYVTLAPVTYVEEGEVRSVSKAGVRLQLDEIQAAALAGSISYVSGGIPIEDLPRTVTLRYPNFGLFPITGDVNYLYLAEDTGLLYSWDALAGDYETVSQDAVTVDAITDATTVGKALLTATDVEDARDILNLSSFVSNAPSYALSGRQNVYNSENNSYNFKGSNTRKLRASLGRVGSGQGNADHVFIGDSMTAGVLGGSENPTADTLQAWPEIYRAILANKGIPSAGTGVVPCIKGDYQYDPRWTTGAWDVSLAYVAFTTTAGRVATFTSDHIGTSVSVYYFGNSTSLKINIDGGSDIVPAVDGVQHVKVHTVTGLPNTTHIVKITSVGTGYNAFVGASVQGGFGLRAHNIAVGGARAHSSAGQPFLAAWDTQTSGYINPTLTGCLTAASITPDVVFVCLGGNDMANDPGYSRSATLAALSGLRTQFASSDFILIGETQLNGVTVHEAFLKGLYDLADTLDVPLVDMYDRFGNYNTLVASGLMGDGAHPNAKAQFLFGQNIGNLVVK